MRKLLFLTLILVGIALGAVTHAITVLGAELITVEGPGAASANRQPEVMSAELYSRQPNIETLYKEYLALDPSISGNIEVMFTLEPDNTVSGCVIVSNTTGNDEFAEAITEQIKTWNFTPQIEEVEYYGWVTITMPYNFTIEDSPEETLTGTP